MDAELQHLATTASHLISGTVIVLDAEGTVGAFCVVEDRIDEAGRRTILTRRSAKLPIRHGHGRGLGDHFQSFDLTLDGNHVGWVLAYPAPPMMGRCRAALEGTCHRLAEALSQQVAVHDRRHGLINELAALLLSNDPMRREQSAVELGRVGVGRWASVFHCMALSRADGQRGLAELLTAAHTAARTNEFRHTMVIGSQDHIALVLEATDVASAQRAADAMAGRLTSVTSSRGLPSCGDVRIGVGSPRTTLLEAHESMQEAILALRATSMQEPVVNWASLGVMQLLLAVPNQSAVNLHLDGLVAKLRALEGADTLLGTLEVYLRNAGNVQKTASALFVHRTTLYHRLKRIEEGLEVDLDCGEDRLALHLALKQRHLEGRERIDAVPFPAASWTTTFDANAATAS